MKPDKKPRTNLLKEEEEEEEEEKTTTTRTESHGIMRGREVNQRFRASQDGYNDNNKRAGKKCKRKGKSKETCIH